MNLTEAVKSGKEFKFENRGSWMYIGRNGIIYYSGTIFPAQFSKEEVLSNKWIVKEEEKWYEGNFKEKFPQGVLCKVSCNVKRWGTDIIMNYSRDLHHPFIGSRDDWLNAKPIPKDEIPVILTEED